MSDKRLKFGNREISKSGFYDNKKAFEIDSIDVNKIKVSQNKLYDKESKSYKYYIGYDDNDVIRSILTELPQMIGYYDHFKTGSKGLTFKIFDKKLFKKYIKIWKKFSDLVGNELQNSMYYEN